MDFGLYIFFAIAGCVIGSLALAFAGSRWIDFLYDRNESILTFPEKRKPRGRFRVFLLALAFTVVSLRCVYISASATEFSFLLFASLFLILMTVTDFEQYCLFDAMMLPFALGGAVLAAFIYGSTAHWIAAGGGFFLFLLIAILSRGAMGGGDVKLIGALGLWLGIEGLLFVIAVGTIAGGLSALVMLLLGAKTKKSFFAYGPYFALTALGLLMVRSV